MLINGAREWGMEDGLKSPGEASLGTEEKRLYVYGRKELRMDKDIQWLVLLPRVITYVSSGCSELILYTLCILWSQSDAWQ